MRTSILAPVLAAALAGAAHAQSINLDLNTSYATPADTYAAAAGPGHWNASTGEPLDLLGLDGSPSGVTLSWPMGSGGPVFINNPFLEGDVHALLDDGLATPDVVQRLRFDNLANATYDVYAYGPPVAEGLKTLFIFNSGDQSEGINITGGWNGDLEEGVNYAHATLEVTDGRIDLDWVSGFFGGSGYISGVQIVLAGECPADVNGDGELNILDFVAYQDLFVSGDPAADCDGNGALNILDFVCYQGLFQAGCP